MQRFSADAIMFKFIFLNIFLTLKTLKHHPKKLHTYGSWEVFFSAAPTAKNSPELHFRFINYFIQSSLLRSLNPYLFYFIADESLCVIDPDKAITWVLVTLGSTFTLIGVICKLCYGTSRTPGDSTPEAKIYSKMSLRRTWEAYRNRNTFDTSKNSAGNLLNITLIFLLRIPYLGRICSTKLVLPKWHKYGILNRVIRPKKITIGII